MDEYGITITDPNYRDPAIQTEFERVDRERRAEKLAIAAAREERMLNEPFLVEKIFARIKQMHSRLFPTQRTK